METIWIIDDHRLFAQGAALMIKNWSANREVRLFNGPEAATAPAATPPDLVLTDYFLPGVATDGLILALRARFPRTPILVVSSSGSPTDARDALAAGADEFVSKTVHPDALMRRIDSLISTGRVDGPAPPATAGQAHLGLTPRQTEILRLAAKGLANAEIAGALGIAEGTVKVHLREAFRTLEVRNRVEALAHLRSYGVL